MPDALSSERPDSVVKTWEQAVLWLRAQPQQRNLVLAAYYDDPIRAAADRYHTSDEWREVQQYLPTGSDRLALDVGAGRGIASYALAREGFRVTALEPDPSAVVGAAAIRGLASEAGLPIAVVDEFSEQLPFSDAAFDLVFARAVLHHTKDMQKACDEFFRVLKPGGTLLAIREHVISSTSDLPAFFEHHPLHHLYGGENAFLRQRYVDAIERAGFKMSKILAPLDSAINFAPHSEQSLQLEIAKKITGGSKFFSQLFGRLLGMRLVWFLAKPILRRFDKRPGRLYSFVAIRP